MKQNLYTFMFLLIATISYAGETVRQYDNQHNITGYTVIEGSRETYFDRDWNRTGYSKNDVRYNNQHNRTGKTTWNGDTGSEFDKNENRIGHIKRQEGKETLYDKNWGRRGYKK